MPTTIVTEQEVKELVSKHLATQGLLVRTCSMTWTPSGILCDKINAVEHRNPTDEELLQLEKEGWERGDVAKMYGRCRQQVSELYSDLYRRTGFGSGNFNMNRTKRPRLKRAQ